MYKKCMSDISILRQQEIEDAFLEALMRDGYEQINISRICENLNIPRKSFYRYFSGRKGVLCAIIDRMLMQLSADCNSKENRSAIGDLTRFFAYWKENRTFLDMLVRNDLTDVLIARVLLITAEDGVSHRLEHLHSDIKREHSVTFLMTGLVALVLQWHQDNFQESPKKMADTAIHLMTRPIFM